MPSENAQNPRQSEIETAPGEESAGPVYRQQPYRDRTTALLVAYKWPIFISVILLLLTLVVSWVWLGVGPGDVIGAIPAPVWSFLWYAGIGSLAALPVAALLVHRFETIEGVELWDMDPVTGKHRHLRVGSDLWDDLVVRSPWGSVAEGGRTLGIDDLQRCQINGRSGFEVMDFRIEDGRPVCVSTWLGEASGAAFRTYKRSYQYAHKRLSKRADRANMLRANQGEIAREAAEAVVYQMIRTSETSGMPHGEEVESVVNDVLSDYGLGDPLDDDLGDDRVPEDTDQWVPGDRADDQLPESEVGVGEALGRMDDVSGGQPAATDGGRDS